MTTSELRQHLIIGLAGRHQSGKSTIANQAEMILTNHDYLVEIITLSVFYKEELAKATGGNVEEIEQQKTKNDLTRWLLEKMGTEYFDSKVLYSRMSNQIDAVKLPSIIFIDGVRKLSDEMFIHEKYNGIVVMIERPKYDDRRNIVNQPDFLPSEVDLPKLHVDYYFKNDSESLVRLRSELRHLLFNEIFNNPKFVPV